MMTQLNSTADPSVDRKDHISSPGLAVGLTLFFLLLVIVAGVIVYKFHGKIRNMFGQMRGQTKEDCGETPQTDSQHYTSMMRNPSVVQTPIYENLSTQKRGGSEPAAHQSQLPGEPEEDLYLACDSPDDAIYSNDPERDLTVYQDEDVYVVPDP